MSIFAELTAGLQTRSADEMRAVGTRLATELPAGSILALHGDLGAGKTTLAQGLAKGFGIHEAVTSPTFAIFTLHRGGGKMLAHIDAYRLQTGKQLDDLMLEDFLTPPYFVIVEWPERVSDWLPKTALHLWLTIAPDGTHCVRASSD